MKNKITINLLVDIMMLVTIGIVSISGFILEIVIPSRYAVKHEGAYSCASQLWGLGRHEWGNMHLWAGIILIILLAIHILLHMKMINSFLKKICPNHISRTIFNTDDIARNMRGVTEFPTALRRPAK